MFVALDDAPLARVLVVLHDVPADRLLVLGVDLRGLDQLVTQLLLDLFALLGVEVDDDGVDHFGCCCGVASALWFSFGRCHVKGDVCTGNTGIGTAT